MTLHEIITELRMNANAIGGGHYTNKEAELAILELANELRATCDALTLIVYDNYGRVSEGILGVNADYVFSLHRELATSIIDKEKGGETND